MKKTTKDKIYLFKDGEEWQIGVLIGVCILVIVGYFTFLILAGMGKI